MTSHVSPIVVSGNVATILLKKGVVAIIDSKDVDLVSGYLWRSHVKSSGKICVVAKSDSGDIVNLHRLVSGALPQANVYHKNKNGLDNRRKNLHVPNGGKV